MTTTVIGSYPLRYEQIGALAIVQSVEEQIAARIRLVSDGQSRGDMISIYAAMFEGLHLEDRDLVIGNKIQFKDCATLVEDYRLAVQTAGRRAQVKAILTGPVTLAFSGQLATAAYEGYRDPRLYEDLAVAIGEVGLRLHEAGAKHFQLDEPFLSVGAPMDLARRAVERVARMLEGHVALHVCGDVRAIFDELLRWEGVAMLSHAFAGQVQNWEVVSRDKLVCAGKILGVGCVDTARERVETEEEVVALIRRAADQLGPEHFWVHPDCGLRSLPHPVAKAKLEIMGRAVARLGL